MLAGAPPGEEIAVGQSFLAVERQRRKGRCHLGAGGGALAFILWVLALRPASPTRVANTMTVNPIAAAVVAEILVGEPITPNLVVGLVAVFAGIWISTTDAS
jgi:drug/metabolite transporter (DMT)-like permease